MLIFVGLLWLNQALSKIDIVIENGQPARIFLELSSYLLPKVLEIAIPISGFAAAVLVTNRLFGESELIVMMTSGRSVVQLAVAFFWFGLVCAIAMVVVVHVVRPLADRTLLDRQDEISREYVTQIVKQGEFVSSDGRYTFYFGSKGQNGELSDILINENVDDNLTITHVAQGGQAVSDADSTKLLLFNGSIQEYRKDRDSLSVVQFSSLSFDLGQFARDFAKRSLSLNEQNTGQLLESISDPTMEPDKRREAVSVFHGRLVKPLLALFAPVLGMSILLVGGFNRSGFLQRIVVAVILMFGIDGFRGVSENLFLQSGQAWPVLYLPVAIIAVLILLALKLGSTDLGSWFRRLKNRLRKRAA